MLYDEMSMTELQEAVRVRLDGLNKAKCQVDHAFYKARELKEYADHDWLTRAQHFIRKTGQEINTLSKIIAECNRADRMKRDMENRKNLGNIFIDVAKRRLDHDLFCDLMNEAREEALLNESV